MNKKKSLTQIGIKGYIVDKMTTQIKRKSEPKSIRFPVYLWEKVREVAEKESRSINWQLIKITKDWLIERGYLDKD